MEDDLGRRSIVDWAARDMPTAAEQAPGSFEPARQKFRVEMPIGRGGMGEVYLVTDEDLKRQVAMKVMLDKVAKDREHRLSFVAEAQATSQLEHPGIPPVHDIGLTPEGRLYFTMKLVQGRTLAEVLRDIALRRRDVQREFTLHKLISIVERICETLQFAHERGVIHRDLKPENIMLGDYGEVHVMDWGLARVHMPSDLDVEDADIVETARTALGRETGSGVAKGTPAYMSPEQIRGRVDEVDARSDVYALGCLLYEVLTLHAAFDTRMEGFAKKKLDGETVDVTKRNPRRAVPHPLADACRRAMAVTPTDRYASARDLGSTLRTWLDGRGERARRHVEAERLAEQGRTALADVEKQKEELVRAEIAAEKAEANIKAWQPVEEKRDLLDARRRVKEAKRDIALAFAEATHLLGAALTQESDNAAARQTLARLWKSELIDAEAMQHEANAAKALAMIERYDDGQLGAFVKGDGALFLASEPLGAHVTLVSYRDQDGVLVEHDTRSLGPTPIMDVSLPMGTYLCILSMNGYAELRYPVCIARQQTWQGSVTMRRPDDIEPGCVHVPGGPFRAGVGRDASIVTTEDFVIQTHPVTFGEYATFLAAIEKEQGKDVANQHVPRTETSDGNYLIRRDDGTYVPSKTIVEGDAYDAMLAAHGPGFESNIAVHGVSYNDALAYCAWKRKTQKRAWRLPTEYEWEKAARGVDGREFPWGDLCDASLGKNRESRPYAPQPEPVGAFPSAVSIYGMRDAGGTIWNWTDSWFTSRKALRVLRGGSWGIPARLMRCTFRNSFHPDARDSLNGFRCVYSLAQDAAESPPDHS